MRCFQTVLISVIFPFLTLTSAPVAAESFTNFGGFDTDGPAFAGMGRYAEEPPPWFSGTSTSPLPGWDEHVRWEWSASYTDAFAPVGEDPSLIVAPFTSTSQIFDVDELGTVTGTLSLVGTGELEANLNPLSAVVDEDSGQIFTPYGLVETYEITERTGSFANIVMDSTWSTEVHGRSARQLIAGQDPAEATSNPVISSSSTFVISGEYSIVPEPGSITVLISGLLLLPWFRFRQHQRQ